MSKREKACKKCGLIIEEGDVCPSCGENQLIDSWKGKIIVLNPEKSEIANKRGIKQKGTYAIKIK